MPGHVSGGFNWYDSSQQGGALAGGAVTAAGAAGLGRSGVAAAARLGGSGVGAAGSSCLTSAVVFERQGGGIRVQETGALLEAVGELQGAAQVWIAAFGSAQRVGASRQCGADAHAAVGQVVEQVASWPLFAACYVTVSGIRTALSTRSRSAWEAKQQTASAHALQDSAYIIVASQSLVTSTAQHNPCLHHLSLAAQE